MLNEPAQILTVGPSLTKEKIDNAALGLPPVPDNVKIHLRYLQDQIVDLNTQLTALKGQ